MATEAQINAITGLYVAYFDRAPDPAGLQFWIDQIDNGRDFSTISQDFANSAEAQAIYPFLSDENDLGDISSVSFITNIYTNLFGRLPDPEGLAFWTNVLDGGFLQPGDMVEAISLGARDDPEDTGFFDRTVLDNKIECARYFTEQASNIATFPQGDQAGEWAIGSAEYLAAVGAVGAASDDSMSVEDCRDFIDLSLSQFVPVSTFNLMPATVVIPGEISVEITEEMVTETVLYWGNVAAGEASLNANTGIPVDVFFGPGGYFQTIASQDFAELDVIDTDVDQFSIIDWSSVTNLSISANANAAEGTANATGGRLTLDYTDGSSDDIDLGEAYFELLTDLMFDDSGISRFYEQEVAVGLPVYIDANGDFTTEPQAGQEPAGTIDRGLITTTTTQGEDTVIISDDPLVLTTTENNMGVGFTSGDNDTIYAGQVELLHGATIDGGGGYNTLEIDAKGHFAQPRELTNIQQITIENLPNIYTSEAYEVTTVTKVTTTVTDSEGNNVADGASITTDTVMVNSPIVIDSASDTTEETLLANGNTVTVRTEITSTTDTSTTGGTGEPANNYPDVQEGTDAFQAAAATVIDLTRADDLENLTVTEGDYVGLLTGQVTGGLNIVGVREDATLTLQGEFSDQLIVQTSAGFDGDGFTTILQNVNANNDLYISQNSPKLNLVSEGGANFIGSLNSAYASTVGSTTDGQTIASGLPTSNVSQLEISGDAHLFIESSLSSFMETRTPVTIDASANTAGVDLNIGTGAVIMTNGLSGDSISGENPEFVTFVGSAGSDRFSAYSADNTAGDQGTATFGVDSEITVTNTAGDNFYQLTAKEVNVTDKDGDITLKVDANAATVTLGGGDNTVAIEAAELELSLGDGDNNVDVDLSNQTAGLVSNSEFDTEANITAGGGENTIRVEIQSITDEVPEVNVTAGDGGNTVEVTHLGAATAAKQSITNITTGAGADTILAEGSEINIMSGGGNDDITIVGTDNDYASDSVDTETATNDNDGMPLTSPAAGGNVVTSNPFLDGVLLNIDTGAGSATITLGVEGEVSPGTADAGLASSNVVAKDGSVITGSDITLVVNTYANLIAADVSGVTSVILDDDAGNRADAAQANDLYNGERAQLTVTSDQFLAIGAENMGVEGAVFNTQGFVKIIVTETTSLTDLGVDDLPRNIDLYLEIADGVTVTMTAEQLHTRIARDGVTLTDDGNTDYANGNVVITGGGIDFDPFNTNDTVQTNINGQVYFGGSISTNDFSDGNGNYVNVTVQSVFGGYNRPADVQSEVVLTVDSDITPVVDGFDSFHTNVEIVGDGDIEFTDALNLGLFQGESANLFTIDFSELGGQATGLTIGNFETVEQVVGNGVPGTEIFVEISADGDDGDVDDIPSSITIGFDNDRPDDVDVDDRALISSGVEQYTVTVIGDNGGDQTATIRLCDKTEDLEVLAFRGNYNDTLTILDAAWGLVFDLEGGSTRKVDGPTGTSNVGTLDAHFEQSDAPAVINIFQADDADNRPLNVSGIILTGAGSLEVNADGPAANIEVLSIDGVDSLDLNATGDLSIVGETPGEGTDADPVDTVIDVEAVSDIDASGVAGTFTATLDGQYVAAVEADTDDSGSMATPASGGGDFTFTGAAGGSELTLVAIDDDAAKGVTIDGGVGGAALTIAENATVDLDESTLINITSVTLENGSEFSISIANADIIGPDNFLIAHGDTATLNLSELGEDPFAIADYADGISVSVVSLIDQPVITLHPDTDLTGIDALMVPEGSTLNLTAEQFQQLDGDGMIIGEDGTMDFTVNITDWTQASVDQNDPDGDAGPDASADAVEGENFILDGITADTLTITMAEDISLDDNDSVGTADITMADGQTLTVADIQTLDGTSVSGGTGTTIDILDSQFDSEDTTDDPDDFIDASGFDVDTVRITGTLAANRNVDEILDGIPPRATKEIINSIDFVDGVIQNVIIVEGTTVQGDLGFTPLASDVELEVFNLTLEGGTEIRGDIDLSQADSEAPFQQTDLQTVNIVSTGTAPNAITGETGNIITGNLDAGGNGAGGEGDDGLGENDLLNVNISGDQALELGGIIFSSETGETGSIGDANSGGSANDDDSATATLNIDSSAAVNIGEIDTSDDDVDAVVINHTGDGDLTVGINESNIDDEEDNVDSITFNGSATGNDKISVEGNVDLSDDTLVNINEIEFDSASIATTITLTQAQFDDVTAVGFTTTEDDDQEGTTASSVPNAILNLVEFGLTPFDATSLDADISLGSVTLAAGDIVLDPTTDLTGVDSIIVPEGGSITLTAAQYQQLEGNTTGAKIVSADGIDSDDDAGPITVNITDLMQADVADGSFSLEGIDSGTIPAANDDPAVFGAVNLSLAENVELVAENSLETGNAGEVDVTLTDGQDLGLATFAQADGLNVTGTGTTDVFFRFDDDGGDPAGVRPSLDASGYDVTNVHALNFFVSGLNIEELLNQLSEDVTLVVYNDPASLGILSAVNRVVVINEGVTIAGGLTFNDLVQDTEVVSLNLTLSGGSTLNGDNDTNGLDLSTVVPEDFTAPANFQLLTINSVGDGVFENLVSGGTTNIINGDIFAGGTAGSGGPIGPEVAPADFTIAENNLLEVVINADQEFVLNGSLRFNKQGDNTVGTADDEAASLTINGTADVMIQDLSTADNDVDALNVTNAGTGNLTVGISSTNTVQEDDVITLNGSATGTDSVIVTGGRDFTNDTINADWDAIVFNNLDNGITPPSGGGTISSAAFVGPAPVNDGDVTITVTQAQFDTLGAAGFQTVEGDDETPNNDAILNLSEFTGAPFDATSLDADINVGTITLAAGDITLDPATNLTGVDSIIVPEGGSLTLTAAQFQQLEGAGTITGADGTTDFTVNVTDLTQADIDPDLDGDGETDGADELFDLSGINADEVTLALIESIELDQDSNLANAQVTMPDGTSLTLVNSTQADGLDVTGTGTTDVFFHFEVLDGTDTDGVIDASGYDVTNLHALNLFLGGTNIEELLNELSSDVELIIYQSAEILGFLSQTNRVVTIQEDVTVDGGLAFNDLERGTEVVSLNLTLEGGSTLNGGIQLDTVAPETGIVAANFQLLTINSEGDDTNVIGGNIIATPGGITGPVAPDGTDDGTPHGTPNAPIENNLLNIVINADQALEMTGSIVFNQVDTSAPMSNNNAVGGDDEAANVTVNGTADVTINDLDTGDGDVIALNVTNAGTGNLTVGISSTNTVDEDDVITLTGSATATDTIVVTGGRDFSGDNIGADWDVIEFNNGDDEDEAVTVTLTQAQFDGVTLTTTSGEDTPADNIATLNLVEFGADPFDATAIDGDIDLGTITMASGDITLDPTTNLTGVDTIIVPEGGTLTLTAAQFQQLEGPGSIIGEDVDTNNDGTPDTPTTEFVVNITDLTQADVDIDLNGDGDSIDDPVETLNLLGIAADEVTLALIEDIVLDAAADLAEAAVTMPDGTTLTLATSLQADGLDVTGGADTTVVFQFAEVQFQDTTPNFPGPTPQIDASEYDITTLKALAVFLGGYNFEFIIDDLPNAVELRLFSNPDEVGGLLNEVNRIIFIEEDVVVPGVVQFFQRDSIILNDYDTGDELRNVMLTLDGGVLVEGDISIPTRDDKDLDPQLFDTLTIVSQGDDTNIIDGDIDGYPATLFGAGPNTPLNNLLNIVIVADQDLRIGDSDGEGIIRFNGEEFNGGETANFTVASGSGDVFVKSLDTEEDIPDIFGGTANDQAPSIATLNVTNDGTGTLTIFAGSDAIVLGETTTTLTFNGSGDIVLDTSDEPGDNGVVGTNLETIDASGHSGALALSVIEDVSSEDFTLTAGTGVTTATLGDVTGAALDLNSTGMDSNDPVDDTAGWTFDFSGAAAGSVLTVANIAITPGPLSTFDDQSSISFDMGADGVLKIEQDLDLTNVNFSFTGVQAIELLDDVELTLTAAQADGLTIIRCEDDDDSTDAGTVNIINLGDDPVDLSGIATEVAGTVTLEDDDVTLDMATDLGFFTVALEVNALGEFDPNSGQTIRFTTEEQAGRAITVIAGDVAPDGNTNSTNVIWLFDSITAPVPTFGDDPTEPNYDPNIGRVWISDALIASEGGDIENLFDSLTSSILRIDFGDVTELVILNPSQSINRVIEVVNNKTVGDLIEVDDDVLPFEEHLASLRIDMGGESTIGNITIGDVVADADTDPLTPEFMELEFNSRTVLSDQHYLATEGFLNDNDGVVEADPDSGQIESEQPDAVNTVGDISVGGTNTGIELDDVTINTFEDPEPLTGVPAGPGGVPAAVPGSTGETDSDAGAAFEFGTLTFAENSAADGGDGTAILEINGDNDVTGKAIDASDADLTTVVIDTADHTASYVLTGGSPAFRGGDDAGDGNTETLIFTNGSDTLESSAGQVLLGHYFDEDFDNNLDGDDNPATDDGDDNTDDLGAFVINRVDNDDTTSTPFAGIAASTLSLIDTDEHGGLVNLGVIADVDGETLVADGGGFTIDNSVDAGGGATVGIGSVIACFGEADVDGTLVSPTLSATGQAVIDGGNTGSQTVFLEVKDLTVETGGQLTLIGTEVTITGDIDLTPLAVEDLILINSVLTVAEDGILRLTVEQVTALQDGGIDVTGAGTVVVTGESDDSGNNDGGANDVADGDADTDFSNLQTATVNLEAVTLAATDGDQALNIRVEGANDVAGDLFDADGNPIAQTIIGSDNNDAVVIAAVSNGTLAEDGVTPVLDNIDVILQLGGDSGSIGDPLNSTTDDPDPANNDLLEMVGDTIRLNVAQPLTGIQIDVDEGFDSIIQNEGLDANDIVNVAEGAEFYSPIGTAGFTATAETTNDGTAVLEAGGNEVLIDVSLATAELVTTTDGWTLIGEDDAGGADNNSTTLVGSDLDDTIVDGGAFSNNNLGKEDEFTGNDGADTFTFEVRKSDVASATAGVVREAADFEYITIDPAPLQGGNSLTFNFSIGNISPAFVTITEDTPGDFDDPALIAEALIDGINARSDASATVGSTPTEVVAVGTDGRGLELNVVLANGAVPVGITSVDNADDSTDHNDDPTDADDTLTENDDRGEATITFAGAFDDGEIYVTSIMRSDGSAYEGTVEVDPIDSDQDVIDRLADDLNDNAGGSQWFFSAGTVPDGADGFFGFVVGDEPETDVTALPDGVIVVVDADADNGGFTIVEQSAGNVVAATSSVIALSSSSILAGTETLLSQADADVITDFTSVDDSIDFTELGAGTDLGAYVEAAEVADFEAALLAANSGAALGGGATYFLTSTADDGGLLFYDANGNGTADGVVNLTGVTADNFQADDII